MWVHFDYANGGNPYITTANDSLLFMVFNYRLEQVSAKAFYVLERAARPRTYAEKKDALRSFAIDWQHATGDFDMSMSDVIDWCEFFEEYGRKYGLIREFRENAII